MATQNTTWRSEYGRNNFNTKEEAIRADQEGVLRKYGCGANSMLNYDSLIDSLYNKREEFLNDLDKVL